MHPQTLMYTTQCGLRREHLLIRDHDNAVRRDGVRIHTPAFAYEHVAIVARAQQGEARVAPTVVAMSTPSTCERTHDHVVNRIQCQNKIRSNVKRDRVGTGQVTGSHVTRANMEKALRREREHKLCRMTKSTEDSTIPARGEVAVRVVSSWVDHPRSPTLECSEKQNE